MNVAAKREPLRSELEKFFEYYEGSFSDGIRTYLGGFLWLPHTWSKRRVVRVRVAEHGLAFAGGVYRHPKSLIEYPVIGFPSGRFLTHRLVWAWHHGPVPDGKIVDHVDRNPFNNLLSNLRLGSYRDNHRNRSSFQKATSKYVGVHFRKDSGRWRAAVKVGGKQLSLGSFDSEIEAAMARDKAARQHYGEFAHLNFPSVRA